MLRTAFLLLAAISCGGSQETESEVAAASPQLAEPPVASLSVASVTQPGPATASDNLDARAIDRELQAKLTGVIANWQAKASKLTLGKATRNNVRVALHVRERGRRGELVSVSADRAQPPASNMKLLTSAAALCLLGSDWRFQTRFAADGPIENNVLRGDLVVFAAGDPLFDRDAAGSVDAWLKPLVAKLSESGVQKIAGNLVLDEGTFAVPGPAPGWPDASQYWQDYCALSGGFSANAGCLTATVSPRAVGQAANVLVEPRRHGLPARIQVTTGPKKTRLNIVVGANQGRVIVKGKIATGSATWTESFSHPDPVELFGAALRGALHEAGIELGGQVVRERGRNSTSLRDLAILESSLLSTLVPINTDSNNSVAEQVLLALGHAIRDDGTREGGASAVQLGLERLGVSTKGFVLRDGSGLSRENRVSAAQLTALIDEAMSLDRVSAEAFRKSLAVGGLTGTLDDRLKGARTRGRVFAKTGWISGVSALSGIVLDGRERDLIFSILIEYPRLGGLNSSCWKPMQDEICEVLAAYDR